MMETHTNFTLAQSGLFINPDYPHIGAYPDGLIDCLCCGEGILEVKCPHCLTEMELIDLLTSQTFVYHMIHWEKVSKKIFLKIDWAT